MNIQNCPGPPRRRRAIVTGADRDHGSVAAEVAIAVPVLVAIILLVGVLLTRGVDTRLRLNDIAAQGARAASLARTPAAAALAAQNTTSTSLTDAGLDCTTPTTTVDTSDFRPGGQVTVTVSCQLDLSSAARLLALTPGRTLTATASAPIDTYRATTP